MNFSSKLLENAVQEIAQLPGIGRRTALRLALYLLKQPKDQTLALSKSLNDLREFVMFCESCHNLSDQKLCEICSNLKRNKKILCVVEDIRDVMAIENTGQFQGIYHVLGGIISPMDGVGPKDLKIDSLVEKVKIGEVEELKNLIKDKEEMIKTYSRKLILINYQIDHLRIDYHFSFSIYKARSCLLSSTSFV